MVGAGGPLPAEAKTEESIISGFSAEWSPHTGGNRAPSAKSMSMHLINTYLGVYLTGVYLIYESSLRAGHGWRESLYRTKDVLRLLIVDDSAVRLLITLAPRGEKLPKRLPNGRGAARGQSSSSASRTVPELSI
jgi:hypothetical protein